jgi:uncharacterized membrane protein
MSFLLLFKFLHVVAAVAVISIQLSSDLYFQRVARSGSTEAVVRLGDAIRSRNFVEGLIFEIAVVLGIVTAFVGGFNFLAPWLLLAYADVVIAILIGIFFAAAPFSAILDAARAGDAAAMAVAVAAPRRRAMLAIAIFLYGSLFFLMVVKPFQ